METLIALDGRELEYSSDDPRVIAYHLGYAMAQKGEHHWTEGVMDKLDHLSKDLFEGSYLSEVQAFLDVNYCYMSGYQQAGKEAVNGLV